MPGYDSGELNVPTVHYNRGQMELQNQIIATVAILLQGNEKEIVTKLVEKIKFELSEPPRGTAPTWQLMRDMFRVVLRECLEELA